MSRGGCREQVHPVGLGLRHDRREPAVGSAEIRNHEVVVVQVIARIVAHGSHAIDVTEIGASRLVSSVVHKSIQRRRAGNRVHEIKVDMAIIPEWEHVLHALVNHVKRLHHVISIEMATTWRGKSGIAAGIGRRGTSGGIKLRQAVELLSGVTVVGPVLGKCAEIMQEAAVFLGHEDDMVHRL